MKEELKQNIVSQYIPWMMVDGFERKFFLKWIYQLTHLGGTKNWELNLKI